MGEEEEEQYMVGEGDYQEGEKQKKKKKKKKKKKDKTSKYDDALDSKYQHLSSEVQFQMHTLYIFF